MRRGLIFAQTVSFFGLGGTLFREGVWKLGAAQVLLGVVTVLVYS